MKWPDGMNSILFFIRPQFVDIVHIHFSSILKKMSNMPDWRFAAEPDRLTDWPIQVWAYLNWYCSTAKNYIFCPHQHGSWGFFVFFSKDGFSLNPAKVLLVYFDSSQTWSVDVWKHSCIVWLLFPALPFKYRNMHVCAPVCVCAQSHWQRLTPSFRGRGFHLAEWPQSFQAETCEITATISHVKQPPQPPTKCASAGPGPVVGQRWG